VIDGGGLGMVANNPELLHVRASKQLILTPHLGELQRFFDKPFSNNKTTILNLAKNFAKEYKLILVMKGNNTITVTPKGKLYKNTTGGPALATAGTGDVLSGIIAGIIAQHITPEEAAPAAVYLHGLAGDLATVKNTEPGVIASDVIDYIPNALKSIELSIR
jgi:NAD(P)H-hydrate epimerase